jgi:metallo-beta-lactamase family protein
MPAPPRQTYLTHGEPQAAAALKAKIESSFHWNVALPKYLQTVDLGA